MHVVNTQGQARGPAPTGRCFVRFRHEAEVYQRRSLRLQEYDYHRAGPYFITVCTQSKACLFGTVTAGVVVPTDAGRMVRHIWDELPRYYSTVEVDACVIMPNHLHGILVLRGRLENAEELLADLSLADVVQ